MDPDSGERHEVYLQGVVRAVRVLLLPHSYSPVVGGVQAVVAELARGLQRRGHSVIVATRQLPPALPRYERMNGVPVVRYPVPASSFSDRPGLLWQLPRRSGLPLICLRIASLLRSHRPHVVNVHFPDKETLLMPVVRRVGPPTRLVVSFHGNEIGRPGDPPSATRLRRLRLLLGSADAVTACSQSLMGQVLDVAPGVADRAHVIHNAIEPMRFQVSPPTRTARPYVFAAGRLSREKGFDLLIDAYARSIHGHAELWIAGTGEEEEALRAQVSRSGLQGRIRLLGSREPTEIPSLIAHSEFVVIPSRADAFGLVGLEALAGGKRVLATRVGGLPEFVEDPPNRLVDATVEGIAQGLLACWGESREAVEKAAERNRGVARRFSPDAMVERFLEVYTAVGQ